MLRRLAVTAALAALVPASAQTLAPEPDDPFVWLEDVEGERALAWVAERNAATAAELRAHPAYDALYDRALAVLTATDRIAYPTLRGGMLHNVWTDAQNPRGLWRRASWESYTAGAPAWQTVLDVDALAAAEGVAWSLRGITCLAPESSRCLVGLSRGGADATETREFDVEAGAFVDGGFQLPEAKGSAAWVDANTLLVSTDAGPGSMTDSGYPRTVRLWTRGTPFSEARLVYEGAAGDVGVWATSFATADGPRAGIVQRPSFFEGRTALLRDGAPVWLDLPLDADPTLTGDHLAVYLRSDWAAGGRTYPAGAVLAAPLDDVLAGRRDFETVVAPAERTTVDGVTATRSGLVVTTLDNVRGRITAYRFDAARPVGQRWVARTVDVPETGTAGVVAASVGDDRIFFTTASPLQPTTLSLVDLAIEVAPRAVRSLPAQFDATGLTVTQAEATSADGTRIPVTLVHRADIALDGTAPTLLYGYGGFEVSLTPTYSALLGSLWLEQGGVYALASIRGGGEFGPAWHRSAQRENRQRAFDDFVAAAEMLVARGIASPATLGIQGGSNGGLLVGAAMTQRPDLFNAVVVSVPLLDMRRYHRLLAGASWMAEYGDPDDPADWAFISRYSPYHNLREGTRYPRPLFTTTTRDDRVHPGHARKMAARMEAMGLPTLYFENTEGGHGAGVTPEQQATLWATIYTYLTAQLAGAHAGG